MHISHTLLTLTLLTLGSMHIAPYYEKLREIPNFYG